MAIQTEERRWHGVHTEHARTLPEQGDYERLLRSLRGETATGGKHVLCVHESGGLDQRHSRNVQAVKLLSYSGTSPWLGAVRMTGKRQRVAARKDVLHSAACRAYELKYARKKVCVCVCVCVCVFV